MKLTEQKSISFIGLCVYISPRWQMESGCERWILLDFYISNARMREYRRNAGVEKRLRGPIHPHRSRFGTNNAHPLGVLMPRLKTPSTSGILWVSFTHSIMLWSAFIWMNNILYYTLKAKCDFRSQKVFQNYGK